MTNKPVTVEISRILEILPHRYPFLMVDRVLDVVARQHVQAVKMVSSNEPWCQGHFAGQPIFPGVLLLEALCQAGAILVYVSEPFDPVTNRLYYLGMERVKFRNTVTPGDQLDLRLDVLDNRSNIWKLKAEAGVDGTLCAQAEILASVVDRGE